MMTKYYTPTIEEFHVGFEYEIKAYNHETDTSEFMPMLIKEEGLYKGMRGLFGRETRVKYLDKEDIESLGFKICKDGSFIKNSVPRYCQWALNKYDDRKVSIKFYHPDDAEGELWFFGNIKNRSELKRLLKQLGIDD